MNWMLLVAVIGCCSTCLAASLLPHEQGKNAPSPIDSILQPRQRRDSYNVIDDCMTVTSKDGHFYYKASPKDEVEPGTTCGLYLITDPERQIEIELLHVDVSCEDGGLISVVDGWELNGEFFPSPEDHQLPLDQRVQSECGSHQVMRRYLSSQNAALVQYRVPRLGQGFSLRVNYVKNPQPCNILVEGTSYVYTLSNHGRRLNCSVTTLFPASISLVSLDVGFTNQRRLSRLLSSRRDHLIAHRSTAGEVVHNCEEKDMSDYLQIGGSSGLDTANMLVSDSICGAAREPKASEETIGCGITTVRLVSSGRHRNWVQVAIRPAEDEDLSLANFMCPA
ncbi:corticotropin-releasing factor-binding protein-like [Daphnia carinata]|uniref:corticotropin-releasing factor-binding protein-like n=1 Tax=Daphnia carinata TaxID=120202 RepID=UPI00257C5AD1|nr:corticotropin-releasing factor-binding protein-like [Daphnia carinata]